MAQVTIVTTRDAPIPALGIGPQVLILVLIKLLQYKYPIQESNTASTHICTCKLVLVRRLKKKKWYRCIPSYNCPTTKETLRKSHGNSTSKKIHTYVYLHKSTLNDSTHFGYVVHSIWFWMQRRLLISNKSKFGC